MSLEPTMQDHIESLERDLSVQNTRVQMYESYLQTLGRSWKIVWRNGKFYVQPQFEVKVGESAWPFEDGEYVLVREIIKESNVKTN